MNLFIVPPFGHRHVFKLFVYMFYLESLSIYRGVVRLNWGNHHSWQKTFFFILFREKCHSNFHAVYWDWICIRIYRHHHYFHGYKIISITCSAMLSNLALFFSFNVDWTLAVRANEPNDWWTWIFNYLCTVVKRKRKNHFIIVHITFSINLHAYTLKRFHFQ